MLKLEELHTDTSTGARAGKLQTSHGNIPTPVFMPVGTAGSVKGISPRELREMQTRIILGNTYHLFLRPGTEIIRHAGGLQEFTSWEGPMLTDSGGYQVFSLAGLNRIDREGVTFQSPLDGTRHLLTPERSIQIQRALGADIIMAFDECTPHPVEEQRAAESLQLTHDWEARSLREFRETEALYGYPQNIFGIVQGSVYGDLRRASASTITKMGFDGYAIGGLSVGESKAEMLEMTALVTPLLPVDQPRYLMGVGKPEDLVEAVARGVDMFDCVLPTRNARHGVVFTWQGPLSIKAGREKDAHIPLDENCSCQTCRSFSRAYLRHLLRSGEMLGSRLASLHNLHFYQELMHRMREAILKDEFSRFRSEFHQRYQESHGDA